MEIIFVRHAEKESEGENPSLTKKGTKQAKHLAKRLKEFVIEEFYCSDLFRAKQTAEIVSKKIKIKPKIETSLREFNAEIFLKDKKKWKADEKKKYSNFISFLKKITSNPNQKKTILLISHGFVNRVIISSLMKIDLKKTIGFRQRETNINIIYWIEKFKNWRLRSMNDNSHVPKKLR
ncbi:histidine phosphatase family protein [Candidatus Pacearchaeota archaeon]|nr:histidine phosphatase family protein [Candidatus Pacearchaeota archaeon]